MNRRFWLPILILPALTLPALTAQERSDAGAKSHTVKRKIVILNGEKVVDEKWVDGEKTPGDRHVGGGKAWKLLDRLHKRSGSKRGVHRIRLDDIDDFNDFGIDLEALRGDALGKQGNTVRIKTRAGSAHGIDIDDLTIDLDDLGIDLDDLHDGIHNVVRIKTLGGSAHDDDDDDVRIELFGDGDDLPATIRKQLRKHGVGADLHLGGLLRQHGGKKLEFNFGGKGDKSVEQYEMDLDDSDAAAETHTRRIIIRNGETILDEELRNGKPVRRHQHQATEKQGAGKPRLKLRKRIRNAVRKSRRRIVV